MYLRPYRNMLNAGSWGWGGTLTACGKGGHDEDGQEETGAEHEAEGEKVVEGHGVSSVLMVLLYPS